MREYSKEKPSRGGEGNSGLEVVCQVNNKGEEMDVQPIFAQASLFLNALDDTQDTFTFQTFDDNQDRKDPALARILHGTLEQHWKALCALSGAGAGVFVTINQTDLTGRAARNILAVRAVFVDTDGADHAPIQKAKPHCVVESSPGNFHDYWFVQDCPLEDFKPAQQAMIAAWGTDKGIHDLPRVMRLPGFPHQKVSSAKGLTGKRFMVRIVHLSDPIGLDDWADRKEAIDALKPQQTLSARAVAGISKPRQTKAKAQAKPSLGEAEEVLSHVDPRKLDYDDWLAVVMALHWCGDEFEDLAHTWSEQDVARYDPDALDAKWHGFKDDRAQAVTFATVCKIAGKAGADLARIASKHAVPIDAAPVADHDYVRTAKGNIVNCFANVELRLSQDPWAGVFAFNELTGQYVRTRALPTSVGNPRLAEPIELADVDYADVELWLHRNFHSSIKQGDVIRAVRRVAMRSTYHPIRNYLEGLTEPDHDLLDNWVFDILGAVPEDDRQRRYMVAVGRAWLISAVARAMSPGCKVDTMLILEGAQGRKKSTFFEVLGGKDYFGDSLPPMGTKDANSYVRGKWIIEIAELDGMNKADAEAAKAFLARNTERFRPAYGHHEITYPRQCIFGGTTNRGDYLRDETGNRRFWPIKCGVINIALLKKRRDALLGAAVAAYKAGERWWLEGDLEALASEQQADRYAYGLVDEAVAKAVEGKDQVFLSDVAARVFGSHGKPPTKPEENSVRAALVHLGFERVGRSRKRDENLNKTIYQRRDL